MRQSRLYVDLGLRPGESLILSPEASHYLAQVLRLKSGDLLRPFNSRDGEFSATIEQADRKRTSIKIGEQLKKVSAAKLSVHLGLGLSRGDRMDFAIQKSTELGVFSITPLYTQFSEVRFKQVERKDKRIGHWQKIAISAAQQSGRLTVPEIHEPVSIEHWIKKAKSQMRLVLSPEGSRSFGELDDGGSCDLLIGPEGGFSPEELKLARESEFDELTMGQRIMRTETAPVAALAILQSRFGDIG